MLRDEARLEVDKVLLLNRHDGGPEQVRKLADHLHTLLGITSNAYLDGYENGRRECQEDADAARRRLEAVKDEKAVVEHQLEEERKRGAELKKRIAELEGTKAKGKR